MEYFTNAWRGDFSDEANAVFGAYRRHLESLAPQLPPSVRELAFDTNLHDGLIRRVVREGDDLRLELRCGDNAVGYFDLDLVYEQASLSAFDTQTLAALARDETASALYDELDVEGPAAFVHRILFYKWGDTDPEITIRFRGLRLTRTPQPDREFIRLESRLSTGGTEAAGEKTGD